MTNKDILQNIMNRLNLSDSSFTERIISQKTVYLLQEVGIGTNYLFNWNHYGVYSKELSNYMFSTFPEQIVTSSPPDKKIEKAVAAFITFAGENMRNPLFLELASSALYLIRINPFLKKEELFDEIIKLKPHLNNREQFEILFEKITSLISGAQVLS